MTVSELVHTTVPRRDARPLYSARQNGAAGEDEARILTEVGEQVLGTVARALARVGLVTIRVTVPEEAQRLMLRPLKPAHTDGRPSRREA
jgi:hypothetical protein